MLADTHEDVAGVVEGIGPVQLARGDERLEDARALGPLFAAGEEPVLAINQQTGASGGTPVWTSLSTFAYVGDASASPLEHDRRRRGDDLVHDSIE